MIFALFALGCRADPPLISQIWFGGDVFVGGGAPRALSGLAPWLGGAGVVNLEGPVGEGGAQIHPDRIVLTHAEGALGALAEGTVVAASIANNHAQDAGPTGGTRTTEALAAVGIAAVSSPARTVRIGDHTVALQAVDLGDPRPLNLPDADLRAVILHTRGPDPPPPQAVDAAIDAGADVVVASGSHAVGPITRRRGAVVAWGLGDLVFHCGCSTATTGLILSVELGTDPPVATVIPVAVGRPDQPAQPHPQAGSVVEDLRRRGSPTLMFLGDHRAGL